MGNEESIENKGQDVRLNILSVLTGDKFNINYLLKLKSMVDRNVSLPFNFLCYTNNNINLWHKGIKTRKTVEHGWWGKIDLFKEKGPNLYFDLDTVIVDDIDNLARAILDLHSDEFIMIKPWKRGGWASGIMGWNGDFSFITSSFNSSEDILLYKWDQRYIASCLNDKGINILPVQDYVNVCSFKHHCRAIRNYPEGTDIVCFHGRPMPHEVIRMPWVRANWR